MDKKKFTDTGDGAIRVTAQYDGTSLKKNTDEGKEPGPVRTKSIVDADPYGIYDDSEHNVAARRTEGTVEEQLAHVGGKYPDPPPLPTEDELKKKTK